MSLHDDDRCAYDDDRADRATRDEAEACAKFVEEQTQRVREFLRKEANLAALNFPRLIDRKDWQTRSSIPLQIDEAIEGRVDVCAEAFFDLYDSDELTSQRNIAETGYDG